MLASMTQVLLWTSRSGLNALNSKCACITDNLNSCFIILQNFQSLETRPAPWTHALSVQFTGGRYPVSYPPSVTGLGILVHHQFEV
ncbi:hypothetical protein B0H17DRAFT_1053605, partial [Mycena rosella]